MKNTENFEHTVFLFGKRKRLFELLHSLGHSLLLFLVLWLSVSLADQVFYFSEFTRWGLFFINLPLLIYIGYTRLFLPMKFWLNLQKGTDLTGIALELGRYFPEYHDTFINIYQLNQHQTGPGSSAELKTAAINQLSKHISKVKIFDRLRFKDHLPARKIALPVILSAFILIAMRGEDMFRSTLRLLNPSNDYVVLPQFGFEVTPGNTDVIKGQDVIIQAGYHGPLLEQCMLHIIQQDNIVRTVPMIQKADSFYFKIENVKTELDYQITGEPLKALHLQNRLVSERFSIDVKIPPRIARLDIHLKPPAYTGLTPTQLDRNIGDITALAGTIAELSLKTDKPVEYAHLQFESGDSTALNIRGTNLKGTYRINKYDNYTVLLRDEEGLTNLDPISYNISLLPDNEPVIDIISPGQDVESPLDIKLQTEIEASDDFGINKLYLFYRYVRQHADNPDSNWYRVPLTNLSGDRRRTQSFYVFDFDNMPISFDDAVKYYAMALDNNNVNGPGKGTSPVYYIRFPSINEIFDSFAREEAEKTEEMEEVVADSEELKKKLEELQRDVKREKKLDWEKRQEIEASIEKQKELQKKLENIEKEIEKLVEKLDQANLISEEVLEKYNQIQELFRDIVTPEMMEALRKLQESMEKPNNKQVQKAFENFKRNQEAFKEKVERTLELLKQVQLEQKMDQLVQQTRQLLEQQEKISKGIEKQDKTQTTQLSEQQEQQKQGLENAQKTLQELVNEPLMQKFTKTAQSLQQVNEQINSSQLSNKMEDIRQQIGNEDFSSAAKNSQQMEQELQNVMDQLSSAQQQLQDQHKTQVREKMLSSLRKILNLSFQQEKVQEKTNAASTYSDEIRKLNQEQGKLADNFRKLITSLVELSRETFFLDPKINGALSKTQKNMNESIGHLGERRKAQAARSQTKAMEGLNQASSIMQQSLDQLTGSSSGTGFQQFMEQMQKMAGMQGQINQETLSLMPGQGNQGELSSGQQSQMGRLAAQQRALQQALQEMSDKMGNRNDILGRIGELGGQMEEVVEDLLKMKVDRKTIDRQRQILSRMLDAQKSVREREYSKQRKSERAKVYIARDPGSLENPEVEKLKMIRDALKKAMNEGYGPDYQKLIEAYFKALSESAANSPAGE